MVEEGLYFFDFNFDKEGPWIGLFYEEGNKVLSHVFRVGMIGGSGIVRYVK